MRAAVLLRSDFPPPLKSTRMSISENDLQSRSRSAGPARCLNLMLLRDRYCRSSILRCGGRYCTACSLVMCASPTRKAKGLAGGKALGVSLPLNPVLRGLRRVLAGRVY